MTGTTTKSFRYVLRDSGRSLATILTSHKAGLAAILGPTSDPSQARNLTIRARCFYYKRKKQVDVDFEAYKAHLQGKQLDNRAEAAAAVAQPTPAPSQPANGNASYPTSFADIVALIESGKPIPGIMDIPDTVLPEKATKPTASRRRKPWEKDEAPIPVGEGTFGNERDTTISPEAQV
jgi:hypothetical protein